jgi:hypothetical protein
MKIALSVVDDKRWQGLLQLEDGEIWKVTLWPGSATEEWRALLQVAVWVKLDSPKIMRAIEEAKVRYDRGMMESPEIGIENLVELMKGDSELARKIREVMEGE